MNSLSRGLPSYPPISLIARKAVAIELKNSDEQRSAFKIIHEEEMLKRIKDYCDRVLNPVLSGVDATIVPIMNGALNICSNIISEVDEASHMELMTVSARSYGRSRQSDGVYVSQDSIIPEKIKNRTLVVIDDVLDTGKTMAEVLRQLEEHKPKQIITVFLIRKMNGSKPLFSPDYCLYEVHSDSWVFGYGMDLGEKYRHLKFVCDANINLYNRDGTARI